MRLLKAFFLVLLSCGPSLAANHYLLSSASGSGNGSDWTNAFTDCGTGAGQMNPTTMVRGDTYFVGTGSYATCVFHTAESSTSVITVKGALAADHGTATGWSNAFGVDVTPATWISGVQIWNGYYVIDGNTGTVAGGTGSYGFAFAKPASCASGNTAITVGPG